jgi:hypothetical protein
VTHTVLRSAIVMIGCVGSLIMLPGAIARLVTLPATGAVTVSRRAPARRLPDTPQRLQARLGAVVFGGGLRMIAARLVQVALGGGAELELAFLARKVLFGQRKLSAALSLSS